jgi:phosphoribosylanthranilate isomerase
MPSVKICGLLTTDMVRDVAKLPVDYLGFLFARSKRQVSAEHAAQLIQALKEARDVDRPSSVGVFVNPTEQELQHIMQTAPLDVIQLHGQESPDFCSWVKKEFPGVKVFKVISVAGGTDSDALQDRKERIRKQLEPFRSLVEGILLDTHDPVYGGGSGKTFAWDLIPPYLEWCRAAGIQLIVAGGLHPDNVLELLQAYGPDGVDVSSGVETDGSKDLTKIQAFVERVKASV